MIEQLKKFLLQKGMLLKMKIYGVESWQNEAADSDPTIYINLAIKLIKVTVQSSNDSKINRKQIL